jgi:hypothetical protein
MSDRAPYPLDLESAPPNKPWRVTIYRMHSTGYITQCRLVGDYRWYWQANTVSWFYHYILRYGCNTWKAKNESSH